MLLFLLVFLFLFFLIYLFGLSNALEFGEKYTVALNFVALITDTQWDSFDAITSRRPYKNETSIEYAISELKNNRGTQFDPELCDEFLEMINECGENLFKIMRGETNEI